MCVCVCQLVAQTNWITPGCVSGDGCVLNSDPVGCRLHMCIYVCICVYMYSMYVSVFMRNRQSGAVCVSPCWMYSVFVCREVLCVCV